MDRSQAAVVLVLRELGLSLDMRTFDGRLIVQKATYLAQAAGVDLGYFFGWYLRGPYCSSLAHDAYAAESDGEFDEVRRDWKLDEKTSSQLGRLKTLIPASAAPSKTAYELELLASVHYLARHEPALATAPDRLSARLQAFGKNFGPEEVTRALKALEREGLRDERRG